MFAQPSGGVELESSRAFFDDDEEEEENLSNFAFGGLKCSRGPIQDQDFESRVIPDGEGYKLYFLDEAGDEDENISISAEGLNIETYVTDEYENFVAESRKNPTSLLCIFNGRIPVGFGKGYIGEKATSLLKIYYTGNQGTVDSLLVRPKSKLVVEVVKVGENLLFAVVDTYAVPSSAFNFICSELTGVFAASHHAIIFHSERLANFSDDSDILAESKIFYMKNAFIKKEEIPFAAKRCPYPNLISGISGTIFTLCQQNFKKPCLVLINYAPAETVNLFSLKPYLDFVQSQPSKNSQIFNCFSRLKFNLASTGSSIPTHISQSNLYT